MENKKNYKNLVNNIIVKLASKNWIPMSDENYLKRIYKKRMHEELNLENPQTFNEKLQWLKLYNRKPEYVKMVDKYEPKKYVGSIIGEKYIIPTLGIYDKFEDINFDKLPEQFVIKCTHDSGGLVICKNKNELNLKKTKKKINKFLKRNYYYQCREWVYKNIKPRILIEKYMTDKTTTELKDYKIYCFNGKAKIIVVCSDRFTDLKVTYYDENWNEMNVTDVGHKKDNNIKKPVNFEEMKHLAEILSKEIPFVRVDFYEINGNVYFGEMTFFSAAGYEEFEPNEYNKIFGDWIELPKCKEEDFED